MTKAQLLKALSEALSNMETAFSEAEITAGTLGDLMEDFDNFDNPELFDTLENLHMMASQTVCLIDEVVGCIECLDQDIRDGDFDGVWK